jgi:hypothetical protein
MASKDELVAKSGKSAEIKRQGLWRSENIICRKTVLVRSKHYNNVRILSKNSRSLTRYYLPNTQRPTWAMANPIGAVMNLTNTDSDSPDDIFQHVAEILGRAQSVSLPHVFVGALFLFVLRAETTYLPISIPAFILGSYKEWTLRKQYGISTIKYSLCSILVCWLGTFAYRLAKRRMKMHKLVRPHCPLRYNSSNPS